MKKYIAEVEYTEYDEIKVEATNRKQARKKVKEQLAFTGQITALFEARK